MSITYCHKQFHDDAFCIANSKDNIGNTGSTQSENQQQLQPV